LGIAPSEEFVQDQPDCFSFFVPAVNRINSGLVVEQPKTGRYKNSYSQHPGDIGNSMDKLVFRISGKQQV
jgi:hypothetical protein